MKNHYPLHELNFKNASAEEQLRTRKVFEDLKKRAHDGKTFLEREKDFFCTCLKLSQWNDGHIHEFEICNDYEFKELYLTYFHNNLEGPFFKVHKTQIIEVSPDEQIKDFAYLMKVADEWSKQIEIENHKNPILQEIGFETRRDLKSLSQKFTGLNRIFRKQKDDYKLRKDKIILQSKFIYLLVKSVIENNDNKDFEIPFSNETIEFTIYSLVHIVSRHYAEPIKQNEDKTYHYENFFPTELHIDLKNILLEIDKLNLIDINKTDNIIFKFKGVHYRLYIQKRFKQVKGIKGNIQFFRIQTFYPLYSQEDFEMLQKEYNENKIMDELSVFIHK
ncbi:hypothetical protein EYY60_07685 [Flavobacterium zhairuonense]|uniref:hypothetical protein n=1 Tax=Flavobacterium zhairuonense TaxID=2493631 RepID=UPI00104B60FB|nr:hypothetical protein [Flavobacterium zhairuonense]KAF2512121.1 hypothetical protein EYY60_07685 [Flavobacterium zhairuonense]